MAKLKEPIRVTFRDGFGEMLWRAKREQNKAYDYILPHLDEIALREFKLSHKQFLTKNPMWSTSGKMRELLEATNISQNQICSVASALLRGKLIACELYMWRVWYLVGDVIITQAGNVFRPCLENNIPWLTKDTVEELHQKRLDWFKRKTDDLEIYIIWDSYFTRMQINEREKYFYLIPT